MGKRVVIVGGLLSSADRNELLHRLARECGEIDWDWMKPVDQTFNLLRKPFQRLLQEMRTSLPDDPRFPRIVKLFHLNGRDEYQLRAVCRDPILPPHNIATADELIHWLLSPESGIRSNRIWTATVRQTALLAILAKLLKNKSFNKDSQGHNWTKEADLLGQAPVNRPTHQPTYIAAAGAIGRANGKLLLTKGADQGKTPKEWCINTRYLTAVKEVFVAGSFDAFRVEQSLQPLMDYLDRDTEGNCDVDEGITSELVMSICRDR
jgi:hypothetical protein